MRKGFTLIELLVVITIIVVLLALLTPALDRAIYQAELVTCAAKQRGLGQAAIQYAAASKRRYPERSTPYGQQAYFTNNVTRPEVDYDLRKLMADYASGQMHMDPLSEEVNMKDSAADDDTYIWGSYRLYFGWRYVIGGQTLKGMYKIGDRWGWKEVRDRSGSGQIDNYRLNILLGDYDYDARPDSSVFISSHPDSEGILSSQSLQDERSGPSAEIMGHPGGFFTLSEWAVNYEGVAPFALTRNTGGAPRGDLDLNFTFADGSTQRYDLVVTDDYPRMIKVGLADTGADYVQVPQQ